ncbi:MAG: TlpA disulfide reductase family protein [Segetibacter sp.]
MPVFESSFKAKIVNDKWNGIWIKGTSDAEQVMPFTAEKNNERFPLTDGTAKMNINGRWAVKFAADSADESNSIAEFRQNGNRLEGTFLTPTGDYRFLEGVVTGNKLKLSGFDGAHAYLFTADITDKNTIQDGKYFSGLKYTDEWSAIKNAKAKVKTDEAAMYLKPGEEKLNFRFPDFNGNPVSINDERFKNKVVIVQLMGSWCPNCMDETAFLSDYYNKNKQRGIEVVALAYEYSTDFQRSQKSLMKFQQRFNVQYPVLITGVTVSDTLRTEKTLPQVTRIKVFPSSIIIDKKGKVRKLDTGFFGPGTGKHYETYKKEFYETVDELLEEK